MSHLQRADRDPISLKWRKFCHRYVQEDAFNVKLMLGIIGWPLKMFKYTQWWIQTDCKCATTPVSELSILLPQTQTCCWDLRLLTKKCMFRYEMWRGCLPPDVCRPRRRPSASSCALRRPPASAVSTPPAQTPWSPSQSHPGSDTWGCTFKGEGSRADDERGWTHGCEDKGLLPFLCVIHIFLWQDGQDLVQNLVWVRLTGQGNVVLRLKRNSKPNSSLRAQCWEQRGYGVTLRTLILRGPSRRPRLLLGVSMLIILSRPLSREPNTFPPRFFFPLSPVAAMSRERDLRRTAGPWNVSSNAPVFFQTWQQRELPGTHLLSGLKAIKPTSGISLLSTKPFLLWSLEALLTPFFSPTQ